MKYSPPAASPDAYVAALTGWRKTLARDLRASIVSVPGLEERIKWGNLVYLCNGPVLLVRAEEARVLFGFWRGKMLRELDDRLVPGGKYDMATITLLQGDKVDPRWAKRLVRAAVALNRKLGDPTELPARKAKAEPAP